MSKHEEYHSWQCRFCSKKFRTRRELTYHKHSIHSDIPSRQPWNKGLTKDSSLKVKEYSLKVGQSLKGKRNGKASTPEKENIRRAKISFAISKRNELIQGGNGGRKDVKWFRTKNLNGVEFIVRGSWELNVAKRLNELGILWIKIREFHMLLMA